MRQYLSLPVLLFMAACANVAMPTGGPRDKTPPELISSTPYSNQKEFTEKTIELNFNEDIKLKNPKEEILIVPSLGNKTVFTVKKKKLIITPELEWLENTTYSINFRDGVQDLTEGNPAENLYLAFSTGPTIDSLSIKGIVKNIFTEIVPEKITIALYQQDTFDIFKHTPTYFTKSNKEGEFLISNLKASTYYIYAFDDKNKNLKVDSKTEKFGFISSPINLNEDKDSVEIFLQMVDSRPLLLTNIRHTDKTSRIRFNKQLDSLTIKGTNQHTSLPNFGADKSELIFYNYFSKNDSIPVQLIAKDSIGQKIDSTFFLKYSETKTTPETLKSKELSMRYDYSSKTFEYQFNLNKPITYVNNDSTIIQYDSINKTIIKKEDILIDSLLNIVTIKTAINPPTLPDTLTESDKEIPKLVLGKGAFITNEQDSSRRITKQIKIPEEEDLGLVTVKIETVIKDYVLQLLTTDDDIIASISNIKEHIFKNLEPRDYKIQIIIDSNKNGKWDAGNFAERREPEKIILYKSEEGKYTFPLRANWEYGPVLIKF